LQSLQQVCDGDAVSTATGLRERKKSETRRLIASVALELAAEHGPDAVTVDDIAAAAGVSTRTVFNHFGTKDEAILGIAPERRAEIAADVVARPAEESPLAALRAALGATMTSTDDAGRLWLARVRLVSAHPQLRAAQVTSQMALEHDLTRAIATRTGLDADGDLYPRLVVAVALTALRTALATAGAAPPARLRREIDAAFDLLETGLPAPR
jgi:AcrR family transcriptional regulator